MGSQPREEELVTGIWEGDNIGSVQLLDLGHRFGSELSNRQNQRRTL